MDYVLSDHAQLRMIRRKISKQLIADALEHPTKMSYDVRGRVLIVHRYQRGNKIRLLLVAGVYQNTTFRVITVIDTSKVKKYL